MRVRQVANGHQPYFTARVSINGGEVSYRIGTPDEIHIIGMYPTPTTFTTFRFAALNTTGTGPARSYDYGSHVAAQTIPHTNLVHLERMRSTLEPSGSK